MASLVDFWIHVTAEYHELAETANRTIFPFPSSYVCEAGFSTMSFIKTHYLSSMDVHSSYVLTIFTILVINKAP